MKFKKLSIRSLLTTFLVLSGLYISACMSSSPKQLSADDTQAIAEGKMPSKEAIQAIVDEAYNATKGNNEGKNADYIPSLAKVDSNLFGIALVTKDGEVYTAGDSDVPFAIESVSKAFQLALAMQQSGDQAVLDKLGVEPTGRPFNSVPAVEDLPGHIGNPLVNAGAMATTSLIKADSAEAKWNLILDTLSKFAGETLTLNEEVYQSEAATNQHNKGIAELLYSYNRLYDDPMETVDIYTKLCSINVTAKQLAVMGATLANHGVNPISKEKLLNPEYVPKLLAVMLMGGFYDEVGKWAWTAGVPAKTGVGGGIVAVVPGKFSVVGYGPRLNAAGNSVKASQAINYIINKIGGNIFKG